MVTDETITEVDQQSHPDGAMFGIVDPANPRACSRSVLCIESGSTPQARSDKSRHNGLRHVLGNPDVMHPHVWPIGMARLPRE